MNDLYATLELDKTASADEIKANYRRLAMRWHPDRNAGSAEAEERFKRISEAYSVLSDPQRRAEYDAQMSGAAAGASFGGTANPFEDWFAGFNRQRATDMFMNEMYALAIELTMQNVGWRDVARELVRRGCPEQVAADIAWKIETQRKATVRVRAAPYFLRSALSGLFGLILLGLFGGLGFGLLGLLGFVMFLSGAYNLVRALYFMTTGNAPKTLL